MLLSDMWSSEKKLFVYVELTFVMNWPGPTLTLFSGIQLKKCASDEFQIYNQIRYTFCHWPVIKGSYKIVTICIERFSRAATHHGSADLSETQNSKLEVK